MRGRRWGHSIEIKAAGENRMQGAMWSTPAARDGDTLIWATEYGAAEGTISVDRHVTDPQDMAFITVEIQRRYDTTGAVVWGGQ